MEAAVSKKRSAAGRGSRYPRGMNKHSSAVAAACRAIDSAETAPSLAVLAKGAGLSPFHFQKVFSATVGLSPKAYALAAREKRARAALRSAGSVTEAIYESGHGSSGRFYERSAGALGMTPTKYRAGGAGETVRFAVGRCALGEFLVAATEKGVCAVFLGGEPGALVRDLQKRFPKARLSGGDAAFERLVARVVGVLEGTGSGAELPLDVRGTAFQRRVWTALRSIPLGKTSTYAEIARRVGAPKATRAVGTAIGANKLAVLIPCHRVVRSGGALSGYRWGVAVKRALLRREGAAILES